MWRLSSSRFAAAIGPPGGAEIETAGRRERSGAVRVLVPHVPADPGGDRERPARATASRHGGAGWSPGNGPGAGPPGDEEREVNAEAEVIGQGARLPGDNAGAGFGEAGAARRVLAILAKVGLIGKHPVRDAVTGPFSGNGGWQPPQVAASLPLRHAGQVEHQAALPGAGDGEQVGGGGQVSNGVDEVHAGPERQPGVIALGVDHQHGVTRTDPPPSAGGHAPFRQRAQAPGRAGPPAAASRHWCAARPRSP
jgi:hypothetical protein